MCLTHACIYKPGDGDKVESQEYTGVGSKTLAAIARNKPASLVFELSCSTETPCSYILCFNSTLVLGGKYQ